MKEHVEEQMHDSIQDYVKENLFNLCCKFIDEHDITCEEAVYQTDTVVLGALEFIHSVCDAVGYKILEEDDDCI
jgi:hypothetical protein